MEIARSLLRSCPCYDAQLDKGDSSTICRSRVIDDWEEITEEFLNEKYEEIASKTYECGGRQRWKTVVSQICPRQGICFARDVDDRARVYDDRICTAERGRCVVAEIFCGFYGADKSHFATYLPYLIATWGIAIAGIAGGFVFGIASDRTFGGRRAPVITFGFLGMAVILALFGLSDFLNFGPVMAACCLVLLSFCVNGAHGMIGGAASMDFGGKKAVATAAGLFERHAISRRRVCRDGRRVHHHRLGVERLALGTDSFCTDRRVCDVAPLERDAKRKKRTLKNISGHEITIFYQRWRSYDPSMA